MTAVARTVADKIKVLSGLVSEAPRHHVGSPVANRLGLQVLRVLASQLVYFLRPRHRYLECAEYQRALEKDGIVAIPNFFAEEQFRRIEWAYQEWEKSGALGVDHKKMPKITLVTGPLSDLRGEAARVLEEALAGNEVIIRLVEGVLRRKVSERPTLSYQHLHLPEGEQDDTEVEAVLHADRHYPCAKVCFYMNDNTEESGAYVYCPGSHRLTWSRLRHEYEFSIREAKLKYHGVGAVPNALVERGRNAVSAESREQMKLTEVPVVGRKNTLVISNNMGFHRRGTMQPGHDRKQIRIVFYYAQRRWYGKLWDSLLKGLRPRLRVKPA
jgi:hypothetical protein